MDICWCQLDKKNPDSLCYTYKLGNSFPCQHVFTMLCSLKLSGFIGIHISSFNSFCQTSTGASDWCQTYSTMFQCSFSLLADPRISCDQRIIPRKLSLPKTVSQIQGEAALFVETYVNAIIGIKAKRRLANAGKLVCLDNLLHCKTNDIISMKIMEQTVLVTGSKN